MSACLSSPGWGGRGRHSRPHPLRTRSAGWYKAVLCPRESLVLVKSPQPSLSSPGAVEVLLRAVVVRDPPRFFLVTPQLPASQWELENLRSHAEGCGGRGRLLGSSWKLGSTPALGPSSLFPRKNAKWGPSPALFTETLPVWSPMNKRLL